MARARRRPRRAGDRQHRQRARRSRPASTWPSSAATATRCASSPAAPRDAELRFTAWHNEVWKPVIAAVNGIVRRRRAALRRRRRHRDRRERRHVPRPARVGRPGHRVRGDRARAQDRRWSRSCAWRWSAATSGITAARARQLGHRSARSSTRPSGCASAAQELAEKIARNSPAAMAATKRALWGALETGLTDACRAGAARAGRRCGATPTRPKGPLAFTEKREPRLGMTARARRARPT